MNIVLQKYGAKSGRIPFDEWIVGLSSVMRARVYANLARIEAGNLGNVKPIVDADGIMELRLFFGPGYRVYMGLDGETLVILLCGGDKKTQRRDIAKAVAFWNDYKSRKGE